MQAGIPTEQLLCEGPCWQAAELGREPGITVAAATSRAERPEKRAEVEFSAGISGLAPWGKLQPSLLNAKRSI